MGLRELTIGLLCGLSIGMNGMNLLYHFSGRTIPQTKKIEAHYVQPSKLEIECRDFDDNGKKEVVMKYNGRTYLLQEDKGGDPVALRYSIVPQQIQTYGGD